VRKLLYCNALVAAALCVSTVGCGGGPTAPSTAVPSQTQATPPAPAPVPPIPPTDPAPAPAPPTPAPMPPAPAPADSAVKYIAHVDSSHWYGTPLFTSPDIEVLRYADRIVFGSLTLPIVLQDDRSLVAQTREMTFSAVESRWELNGIAGQASGVWTRQEVSK
jgi:hypothetical protein